MSKLSQDSFNKLARNIGNRYAAVQFIAQQTHKLSTRYHYEVIDSQLISWILTGVKPKSVIQYESQIDIENRIRSLSDRKITSVLNEILCYVDDSNICDSVRCSITESKDAHHLIYVYKNIQNESQKARVRILTRMVWHSL